MSADKSIVPTKISGSKLSLMMNLNCVDKLHYNNRYAGLYETKFCYTKKIQKLSQQQHV